MYLEEIEKRSQLMISIYKTIYKIVFKYGIFFLILIWSIYIIQSILRTQTNIITFTDNEASQKALKIKTFEKRISTIKWSWDLTVFVWLGSMEQSWTFLSSYNNLASYRGYTLPRYFAGDLSMFYQTDFLKSTDYTKAELEWFITKLRSIKDKNTIDNIKNRSIPITDDIVTTFNLQCLSQSKIYNGLCQIFTDNFTQTFMLYNISADIEWFKDIFNTLIEEDNAKYKNILCKNLIYYSYYSENTSNEIKSIMKSCSSEDYDAFNKFVLFYEIQQELENKFISNTVYADNVINEYKTSSFLQILFEDINNNKINIDRINSYLDFVEELLKEERMSLLETNMIYYFNNYELKNTIENPELFMKVDNKTDLNNLLKRINNINNGNLLIGYKWLKYKVNESILMEETAAWSGVQVDDYQATIDKLLGQINNFSIDERQISWNQILTKWTLTISTTDTQIALPVKMLFQEQSSILFIKKIDINGQTEVNSTINTIITNQQWSFWDLQKYLSENINLLQVTKDGSGDNSTTIPESFCDKAREDLSWVSLIDKCDNAALLVGFTRNGKKVGININYENYVFKSIDVSDPDAKSKIIEYLNRTDVITKYSVIDESNMTNFIKDLLNLFDGKWITSPTEFNASENTVIVLDTVKKYMGVKLDDIVEKGNRIAISFALSWWNAKSINFIGNYNVTGHSIEQLYFKDITIGGSPALIKNLQLTLDDANSAEVKKFTKDPVAYIKSKSIENYLLYMKNIQ